MRYWIAGLLSIAIAASADTLYDELKKSPPEPWLLPIVAQTCDPTFSEGLRQYQLNAIVQTPFGPITDDEAKDYSSAVIHVNRQLPYRYRELIEDSAYLQLVMLSSIGALALMPPNITNWNMEDLREKTLFVRWNDNVFNGPVWDNDDWAINYIGHPVSGAYYYTLARNDGMSAWEAAAFSAVMSTFFWEYGYEAFAEVPSIQDLIVTPLVGSILGEGMMVLQGQLDRKGGMLLGSRSMGSVGYFFLDPLGHIASGIKNLLDVWNIRPHVTMTVHAYPGPSFYAGSLPGDRFCCDERAYGVFITLR